MTLTADQAARAGMTKALRAARVAAWKFDAHRWITDLPADSTFTADDLVAEIGKPDEGDHRANAIGAIISSWSKRDLIIWTGSFRKSERVEGHGNLQRIWRKCRLAETSPDRDEGHPLTTRADPSERGVQESEGAYTTPAFHVRSPFEEVPETGGLDPRLSGASSEGEQLDLLSGLAA